MSGLCAFRLVSGLSHILDASKYLRRTLGFLASSYIRVRSSALKPRASSSITPRNASGPVFRLEYFASIA